MRLLLYLVHTVWNTVVRASARKTNVNLEVRCRCVSFVSQVSSMSEGVTDVSHLHCYVPSVSVPVPTPVMVSCASRP